MKDEDEIGNEQLELALKKLKWEILKDRKPEFIRKMIVKALRASGIRFFKQSEYVQVEVLPVTMWPKEQLVQHGTMFVYEGFRGWRGVVLKEWETGEGFLCKVRIKRTELSRETITTIKKEDLTVIQNEKRPDTN